MTVSSFLPVSLFIRDRETIENKQLGGKKKKAPRATNKAATFQGGRTGGNATDQAKEPGHEFYQPRFCQETNL